MENPKDLKYAKEHEWIKVEDDIGTVGITDFAQEALSDVVFIEPVEVGTKVEQSKKATTIESVKSVSDLFAPVSGEIAEVNTNLENSPDKINKDAFGEGWIAKIKLSNPDELNSLMSPEDYDAFIKQSE